MLSLLTSHNQHALTTDTSTNSMWIQCDMTIDKSHKQRVLATDMSANSMCIRCAFTIDKSHNQCAL